MPGINSILDIGRWALFASQSALETTSNNITNVNTEGYHRRYVVMEEAPSIDYKPGQIGTGVRATEVVRQFDQFVEDAYNTQSSARERWEALYNNLRTVESLFNETTGIGVSSMLNEYFSYWQNLSQRPEDFASREALVGGSKNLINILHVMDTDMTNAQRQIDDYITQDVTKANSLVSQIADINNQINTVEIPGQNNANELRDDRDRLVRDLAEIIDINYIDNGGGNVTITTKAGQTLVDGVNTFTLAFESAQSFKTLTPSSSFDGDIYFDGADDFEYTVEVVQGGSVSNGAGAATFKVSMDGGNTWIKDEDGQVKEFSARSNGSKIKVQGLDIWFGTSSDSSTAPTTQLSAGDKFEIVPKKGLYWYETSSSKVNITPQIKFNGEDNPDRATQGRLAGNFFYRDNYLGKYKDKLDTLAGGLIWETNLQHSQGAGLEHRTLIDGTYSVYNDSAALGSDASGLAFNDKISSGSASIYVYNATTGNLVSNSALDFDSATPGIQNFDPTQHSLEDVRDAFNNTFGSFLNASIVNHKLRVTANSGYEFSMGADTTGMMAALGVNTFFDGSGARDIALNQQVREDLNFVNAGHVNGAGEANQGDNTTALGIAALQTSDVSLTTVFDGTTSQTLTEYYDALVGNVGGDTSNSKFNYDFQTALSSDLNDRQQEISGVNLDQEMSDLIKYQHSYTAAAKLITTADQMMQTILGLKQ